MGDRFGFVDFVQKAQRLDSVCDRENHLAPVFLSSQRGATLAATCADGYEENKPISHVINCTHEVDLPSHALENVSHERLPVSDFDAANLLLWITDFFDIVDAARRNGRGLLIFCHSGGSRAAFFAALLLLRANPHMSVEEVVALLEERRPCVDIRPSWVRQLEVYVLLNRPRKLDTRHPEYRTFLEREEAVHGLVLEASFDDDISCFEWLRSFFASTGDSTARPLIPTLSDSDAQKTA
ncbi:MAG: hypothetical protein MHM6MM_007450 [Cercozoa sp. M6MM]